MGSDDDLFGGGDESVAEDESGETRPGYCSPESTLGHSEEGAEEGFAQKKAAEEELAAKKPAIKVGAAEEEADADAEEADAKKEATDDEGPSVGIDGSWHHYF